MSNKIVTKYAVVETGGGFDCSFGVGVQKALIQHFKLPLPAVRIGSSGSTMTTSFLTADQENTGYKVLTECLSDPTIVKKEKFITEIDVEKLVGYIEQSLNLEALLNAPHKAFLALTEYETGKNKYVSNHDPESKEQWVNFMKASMAMPLLSKKKIIINGVCYTDGDLAASLLSHIEKALSLGAEKVIAINNHSPGTFLNLNSLAIFVYMLADKYHRKILYKRIKNYQRLKEKIEKFRDKIIFLAPDKPLPTTNFNNTKEAIKASINMGYEFAFRNKKLRDFISELSK